MPSSLRSLAAVFMLSTFASLPSIVLAQQSASILLVNVDPQPLVGSIVGTNKATTTYQIQCSPGTGSNDCGYPGPFTYIKEGTSSIQYTMAVGGVTGIVGCSLDGTTSAICTASGSGSAHSGASGSAIDVATEVLTTTLPPQEIKFTQIPITGGKVTAVPSTGAAMAAASTRASSKKPSVTSSTAASTGSPIGQAQPSPTGSTGGATSLESRSIIAFIGAAAMAAVMI